MFVAEKVLLLLVISLTAEIRVNSTFTYSQQNPLSEHRLHNSWDVLSVKIMVDQFYGI